MNKNLKTIRHKIKDIHNAQDSVTAMMEKVFPEGGKIVFKRNNMKKAMPGTVYWAHMLNGYAELKVRNLQTGKDIKISINDVVEV